MCKVSRSAQQQNDHYMDGARDIKKLADRLSSHLEIEDEPTSFLLCQKELDYLRIELISEDVDDVHFVLRGRLQYLVTSLNFICEFASSKQLISLFEAILPALIEIVNILERRLNPLDHIDDKTSWFKMSHIALNCLVAKILRKYPQSRSIVGMPLSESLSMCSSSLWEVQYLGLSLILSSLISEHLLHIESISALSNASLKASASSRKPPAGKLTVSASSPAISSVPTNNNSKMLSSQSSKKQLISPSSRSSLNSKSTRATMKETSKSSVGPETNILQSSDDTAAASDFNAMSAKIVSTKGLPSAKSFKLISCIEEMYKSGFFRTLVWLLLHQNPLVRSCAAEILLFSVVKTSLQSYGQDSTSSDLWACCLEQGIVPQLEYVCQSCPSVSSVNGTQTVFPEPEIIEASTFVLVCIAKDLMQSEGTRSRVFNAMLHSGNTKLRLNIFSGLLYCCSRYPGSDKQLGRVLWESRGSSSSMNSLVMAGNPAFDTVVDEIGVGGGLFNELLTSLSRDVLELKSSLAVINHFLIAALQVRANKEKETTEISTQTNNYYGSDFRFADLVLSIEPTVLIIDTDRVSRMKCPSCTVIGQHSPKLAGLLTNSVERQLQRLPASVSLYGGEAERLKATVTAIESMSNDHLCSLHGSYRLWQEIFSHMVDSFIMKASVSNMSTSDLIESFHIATRYDMKQLQLYYSSVLADRISIPTFLQIMQCAVGLRLKSQLILDPADSCSFYSLHLKLSSDSVAFLLLHCDKLVTTKRPLETTEIIKCLRRIVYYLLSA